jgi:hypothetical protein
MRYKSTLEFPQWVLDFHDKSMCYGGNPWPHDFALIASELEKRGQETALEWEGRNKDSHPYTQGEIDTYMGARVDYYERYPVFCANKGFRPDEWDFLYDSKEQYTFSRWGTFIETKIGEWYFVLGFNHD